MPLIIFNLVFVYVLFALVVGRIFCYRMGTSNDFSAPLPGETCEACDAFVAGICGLFWPVVAVFMFFRWLFRVLRHPFAPLFKIVDEIEDRRRKDLILAKSGTKVAKTRPVTRHGKC